MLTLTPTPSSQGLHVTFRGGDVCAGCRLTGRDQVRGSRPRGTGAARADPVPPSRLQGRLLRLSHAAGLELDFVHYNVPEEVGPIVSALFCAGAEAAGFPSGAGGLPHAGAPRDPAGLAGVLAPLPAAEAAALLADVPAAAAAAALQVRASDRGTRPRKGRGPPESRLGLAGGRRLPCRRRGTDRRAPAPAGPQRVPVGHATEIIAAMEPARAAAVLGELPPSAAAAVLGALPRDVADAVRQALEMEPAALPLCAGLLHALEAVLDPSGRMVSPPFSARARRPVPVPAGLPSPTTTATTTMPRPSTAPRRFRSLPFRFRAPRFPGGGPTDRARSARSSPWSGSSAAAAAAAGSRARWRAWCCRCGSPPRPLRRRRGGPPCGRATSPSPAAASSWPTAGASCSSGPTAPSRSTTAARPSTRCAPAPRRPRSRR